MRQSMLFAVVGLLVVLVAEQASAQTGFREIPSGYPGQAAYGYYAPGYYYPVAPVYGYQPGRGYSDPHSEAVRRVQAAHSRSRFYTHPQSLYNGVPRPDYDPRWPYGY